MIKPLPQVIPECTGWLISPTRNFVLCFIRNSDSQIDFPEVITQLWYCTIEGIPTQLKTSEE